MTEPRYALLFDVAARRPACTLLQAVARADTYFLQEIWPPVTWLEQPTATMRRAVVLPAVLGEASTMKAPAADPGTVTGRESRAGQGLALK